MNNFSTEKSAVADDEGVSVYTRAGSSLGANGPIHFPRLGEGRHVRLLAAKAHFRVALRDHVLDLLHPA
jgi:hypothetical protein